MDRLFFVVHKAGNARIGGGDSFSDRLSSHYTLSILAFFTFMVATRQYVSEPISCWCPVDFSSSMVSYANKVCWTTSTYYLPFSAETIPKDDVGGDYGGSQNPSNRRRRISYYQWMSLIFVAEAVLFYVPRALWRLLSQKSGLSLHTITDTAIEYQKKSDPRRVEQMMTFMVRTLKKYLFELQHGGAGGTKSEGRCSRVYCCATVCAGNYMTIVYIFVKVLYVANVVGQVFLLNVFLGTDYHSYGFEVLRRMTGGEDWTTSDRFPRIAFCNFRVRVMGGIVHRHTVQCALPMNLLNEMFFIVLWFWFVFVGVVTVASLFRWLYVASSSRHRSDFVRTRLYAMGRIHRHALPRTPSGGPSAEDRDFDRFVTEYLRRDGFFVLCMVAKNSSDVVAGEVISGLWDCFNRDQAKNRVIKNNSGEKEEKKVLLTSAI